MTLDLLLCCGEDENAGILVELQKANHLGITLAFYWRVATLYFFRFHRDVDRAALRQLLSGIRKMERHIELPRLVERVQARNSESYSFSSIFSSFLDFSRRCFSVFDSPVQFSLNRRIDCVTRDSSPIPNRSLPHRREMVVR